GFEFGRRQLRDELVGELGLDGLEGDRRPGVDFIERPDLVRVVGIVEHEPLLVRTKQDELLFALGPVATDRYFFGAIHRLAEQAVGLVAPLVGPEVVSLRYVDPVDRARRYE